MICFYIGGFHNTNLFDTHNPPREYGMADVSLDVILDLDDFCLKTIPPKLFRYWTIMTKVKTTDNTPISAPITIICHPSVWTPILEKFKLGGASFWYNVSKYNFGMPVYCNKSIVSFLSSVS